MKRLFQAVGLCAWIIILFFVSAFLSTPQTDLYFGHLNVIFALSIVVIGLGLKKSYIWTLFLAFIAIDLYSSMPFGLYTLSALSGLLIVEMFMTKLFTDKAILAVLTSCLVGMVVFRAIFAIFSVIYIFYGGNSVPAFALNVRGYILEIIFTACLSAFLFKLFKHLMKIFLPARFIIFDKNLSL